MPARQPPVVLGWCRACQAWQPDGESCPACGADLVARTPHSRNAAAMALAEPHGAAWHAARLGCGGSAVCDCGHRAA